MTSKEKDSFFLLHIADACEKIIKKTDVAFEDFIINEDILAIVERKFEILGEAAKNLSREFREKHSDIQWSGMAGFRDIVIHHYFSINYRQMWGFAKVDVPDALKKIKALPEFQNALQKVEAYNIRHDPGVITGMTNPEDQKSELCRQVEILVRAQCLPSMPYDTFSRLTNDELVDLILSVSCEKRKELIDYK